MFNVLILLVVSAIAGYALRNFTRLRPILSKTTTLTVLVLLIVFGVNIGSNKEIISNLQYDGIKAVVIALFGVAGSVMVTSLYRFVQNRKGGARNEALYISSDGSVWHHSRSIGSNRTMDFRILSSAAPAISVNNPSGIIARYAPRLENGIQKLQF